MFLWSFGFPSEFNVILMLFAFATFSFMIVQSVFVAGLVALVSLMAFVFIMKGVFS